METLFEKLYPDGCEHRIDTIIKVYGRFCKDPTRLEFIVNKLCNTGEWKKVMCFYPDEETNSKLMVFVANTSEYYITGVVFKPEVNPDAVMQICMDLNKLLFWVDIKNMLRIICSVKRDDQAEYDAKCFRELLVEYKEMTKKPREPG